MTRLEEKAAEYSFNISSKIYQSCKTQEETKQWKDEIEQAYICGHNQCFQDFMEKARTWFFSDLYKYLINSKEISIDEISRYFKNYMQNESEN